jgi:hypothetical protein
MLKLGMAGGELFAAWSHSALSDSRVLGHTTKHLQALSPLIADST